MFDPAHPGEILQEGFLEPAELSVTEAAKRIGVTRKTLSEFINGRSGVSTAMAIKLARACNNSPQFWLNLQNQYDLWNHRNLDVSEVRSLVGRPTA